MGDILVIRVTDIKWDTEEEADLPDQIALVDYRFEEAETESELAEMISNYLSDTYGFCHKGFSWEIVG